MATNILSGSKRDLEGMEPLQRENETPTMINIGGRKNLYIAAICANLSSITAGCAMGWSSPSIPKLTAEGIITDTEGSWVASLLAIGASIGPFISYKLVDRIGRKMTIILAVLLLIISWIILGFAPLISSSLQSDFFSLVNLMYVARFLSGVGCGCTFMVTPMYIAEISDTQSRSALGSIMQLFLVFGFLIEYCIGPYYSFTVLTIASLIPPCICLIVFICILPESPLYLSMKKQNVHNTLQWLREHHNVTQEINEIEKSLEESQSTERVSWFSLLINKRHMICLFYGLSLVFFQQLSGINIVLFYAEAIFKKSTPNISSSISTIIVGFVFMISSIWTPLLTKKYGIKCMLLVSSILCAGFQGILGLYFYLKHVEVDLSSYDLVPVTCVVMYIIFYGIGLGPLPWAVMGEIYSPIIKSKGSALTASFCWILTFILTKYFDSVSNLLGPYICFWAFSIFCIISYLFIKIKLPDTKGLTLKQIQQLLYT